MTLLTSLPTLSRRAGEHRRAARPFSPDLVILGLLAFATFVTGVVRLGRPLWLDEVASMRAITGSGVGDVLRLVSSNESTPPLWYLLGHGVYLLVGSPERTVLALRVLALVESTALVGITFVWVRRFMSTAEATLVGALLCFGSLFVQHRVELRAYATLALLVVLSAMALEAAARRPTPARLGVLACVEAAGVMTHYFFAFSLIAGAFWACVAPLRVRTRIRLLLATAAATLALLPWLPSLARQSRAHHAGFIGPFDGHQLITVWKNLYLQDVKAGRWAADLTLALFILVALGTWRLLKREQTRLAGLYVVVPFVEAATLWALGQNIFDVRNLIVVAPFAAMAVAAATRLQTPRGRVAVTGVGVVAMAAAFASSQLTLHRTSYDSVGSLLSAHGWHRSDPVVFFGSRFFDFNPVAWYLPHQPMMVRGRPTHSPASECRDVFVVSETPEGQQWLRDQSNLTWSAQVPFYGNQYAGERRSVPVVVAEIRSTDLSLLEDAKGSGASLFYDADTDVGCLER